MNSNGGSGHRADILGEGVRVVNTVVVYSSKSGNTEQYAKWIAEALGADLHNAGGSQAVAALPDYQNLIFGMPIYGGLIYGAEILRDNFALFKDKNIFLFVVGVTDVSLFSRKTALANSFPRSIRKACRVFQLRGDYDFRKLSFSSKFAVSQLQGKLQLKYRKQIIDPDERELLSCLTEEQAYSDRGSVEPLIEAVLHPVPREEEDERDGLFFLDQKGILYR